MDESQQLDPAPDRAHRRWAAGALTGAAASLLIHAWMLSAGTWNLFRWGRQSDLYDAQARALLNGTFAMDQRVLGIESFARGDQHFMYFGPVPAVLRLPVVAFTRSFDGRLAAVSMLLALVVATWALLSLGWRLRSRVLAPEAGVSRLESVAVGITFFAMIGGSSLLYASSRTWIYHEAILWGVALTLASLASLLKWLDARDERQAHSTDGTWPHRHLVNASMLATLALLTRPSVGGGALAAIGIVAGREMATPLAAAVRRRRDGRVEVDAADGVARRFRESAMFAGVVVVPVIAYSVINWIKFRRLLGVPFDQQGFTLLNEQRREMLAANGGSLFNVNFIPTNLFTYLRPDLIDLDQAFPYIHPTRPAATIGSPFFDLIDFTSGIPTTMPFLLGLGIVGILATWRRSKSNVRALWPLLVGCALGTVAVLAIGYLANRYQSDFLPLLMVAALIGLPVIVHWLESTSNRRWTVGAAGIGLALVGFGTLTNLALGYGYQRVFSPSTHPDAVASYIENQRRVDGWFGDGQLTNIILTDALPVVSQVGDLAIVGECDGLYISDGVVPLDGSLTHWRLAELSPRSGAAAGTMTLANDDGEEVPFLQIDGEQQSVTVSIEVDQDKGTMIAIATSVDGVNRGPDLPLNTDSPVAWEVFADPFVGRFEVYIDHRVAVFGQLLVGDRVDIEVGDNVVSSAVGVPVCEALQAGR